MAELLIELFSEEIPARMQGRAAEDLEKQLTDGLKKAGLAWDRADAFSTPRRLTVVIDGIPDAQPDVREERKGPKVGAPEKAVQGFLGSVGLTLDQVEKRETPKGEFLFAVIEKKGQATDQVLPEIVTGAINALPWPKSMRWGANAVRWVRPLRSMIAMFDGRVMPVEFGPVTAGSVTYGHRFMAPDAITVTGFEQYRAALADAFVMLDAGDRAKLIADGTAALAEAEGLTVQDDPGLLAEVAGLVEWPVPLVGSIDDEFMTVPGEVLTSAMRTHQKYFSLEQSDGALAPRFAVVSNLAATDGGAEIVHGNEKVLRARLSDAKFFWDQDLKQTLESRLPKLDAIVFHARMGSVGRKSERLAALAGHLASFDKADAHLAERAARLAKADLVSEMVGEFPELQGLMGQYYAKADGETADVADAIAAHYSPAGPNDACPTAPVSVAVALADKLDTLVGFFAIDEKPTGSKDPFALRRAALGITRLVLENRLRLPLADAFGAAYDSIRPDLSGDVQSREQTIADLMDFMADRLKVHLRDQGVRHDLVTAVFALGGEDDLVRLLARVDALSGFVASDDGTNLLAAYRRAANILRIEEKKDKARYTGQADRSKFAEAAETDLGNALTQASDTAGAALADEDFQAAMTAMAGLRGAMDTFFDAVTVNEEDLDIRVNRLILLSEIRTTLHQVADFSHIEK